MSLDFRSIHRELSAQGWEVSRTQGNHWKAIPPNRTQGVVIFAESNEPRALKNTLRDLRASGFQWSEQHQPIRRFVDRSEAVEPEPPPPSPLPPVPPPAPSLDDIFSRLKEARAYVSLATDHVAETLAAFEAARAECEAAKVRLAEARACFDAAFGG